MHIIRAAFFVAALGFCQGADHGSHGNPEAEQEHHQQLHHHHSHNFDISPPSPIPAQMTVQKPTPPKEYDSMAAHVIDSRDHGCSEFKHDHDEADGCIDIWLKNKFSAAGIAPRQFLTEFEYHGTPLNYRPVVTWVEAVEAQYVRACAAAVPGHEHVLAGGKIKWVALYNYTQGPIEQSGHMEKGQLYNVKSYTADKHCFSFSFPQPFSTAPVMKFTLRLKHGYHSAQDAMVVFAKGITNGGAVVCVQEFHAWARYHHDYELFWYGIANQANNIILDDYSAASFVNFPANDLQPTHERLNDYYCKNVTLPTAYWPCPSILVQAEEPNLQICESPVTAWVSHHNGQIATLCYRDRRGLENARKTDVRIHYIIYGAPDKCNTLTCPANTECIHQADGSPICGCIKSCAPEDDVVCGSDMKEYPNRCELMKQSCESGFKFVYAHKGKCEKYTFNHGRQQLTAVPSCHGLYCGTVSTDDHVWYKDAKVNVQISTAYNGLGSGKPSASWVEEVTPKKFKACVMLPGRSHGTMQPTINWFAYQGEMAEIKSHRVEVGDWQSGTHCVPLHERKPMQEAEPFHPDVCPQIRLQDVGKVDQDGWRYDAHLMSQVYGQHHHEWFKRMLMGYGVKKLNLTSGMEMDGVTFMMTVEQTKTVKAQDVSDAVNVWLEYDEQTHDSYICLRELQNFDGKHEGIHVHWTLFNKSMIHDFGFSHKVHFKPSKQQGFEHKAQCQTKAYLPAGMYLINSATTLVSLKHSIKPYSAMDSMKKYHMHRAEMMKGMSMGHGQDSSKKEVVASWMMPHMWRANLTGWRPHMRIEKNADYSAWIENMNSTHVTVCQASTFNGHSHNGVSLDVFIMPDRCSAGFKFINNHMCAKFDPTCRTPAQAHDACKLFNAYVASPDSCQSAVHLAFLAQQQQFVIAKTDAVTEGNWVPGYGAPQTSTWDNWAPGNPTSGVLNDNDCANQRGTSVDKNIDVKEFEQKCSDCASSICVKPASWMSCNFRNPDYCNNCGKCNTISPFSHICACIPPYGGPRCDVRPAVADP
ncbi:uncharacterized protein [Clytia hemisphaerica]|uniref:Kazal-like domain-containing protein n=1 Tax=Clytia hemisphaerica TaxID=252671 RepID=A0A7M5XN83_9CNID